ncbi:MAG: hypothetical protein M1838_002853 [Thelocarpon superellum]|nr:MAG: hypothetical protein M1838_002853 [Thelocarpon superellum]
MCSFEHSIGLCGKHQTCMQALLAKLQGMNQTQIFDADETIACVGRPGLVGELCIAGYVNYILDDGSGSPVFKDGFSAQDAANSTQALINAGCTTCGISILNSTLSDFDLEDPQQTDTVIISIDGYAVDYRAQIFQG